MNRPNAVAMHMNARRYRSRLMAVLLRRLARSLRRRLRPASPPVAARPRATRYPMPQQ